MKYCCTCCVTKPTSEFYKDKHAWDGFSAKCKLCVKERNRGYYLANKERTKERRKKYYFANKPAVRKLERMYEKRLRKATPKWLTREQRAEIRSVYEHMRDCRVVTGEPYHVDHIVPLKGRDICGLHVPWNLQVLPGHVNDYKGARHDNV